MMGEQFPALALEPRESVTQRLIDRLQEAKLDIAIVALPISEPTLQEFTLFDEDFVLVRPMNQADDPVPSPLGLQSMRLLLLEEGHCFRDQALSFCQTSDQTSHDLMEGSSLTTLVQMVSAGIGVTLVPEMALPLEVRSADISLARFDKPSPSRRIGMVWRKTNPLSDRFVEIGEAIKHAGLDQLRTSFS